MQGIEPTMENWIRDELSYVNIEAEVLFVFQHWFLRFKNEEDKNLFKLISNMANFEYIKICEWYA